MQRHYAPIATPVALVSEGSGVALFEASEAAPLRGLRHIALRVDRENFDAARDHLAARGIPTVRVVKHGARGEDVSPRALNVRLV